MSPSFGKVVTEVGYRQGKAVHSIRRTETSVAVNSRQELFDHILTALDQLDNSDSVQFTVVADRDTRQPARIVVVSEEKL